MPPTTRNKSGILPPKKISYCDPDEDEEEEEEESDQDVEHEIAAAPEPEIEEVVVEPVTPPKPVFERFSTKAKLQDGFCIVRQLASGRYELVNLSQVDLQRFSSEEIGSQIKKAPALLGLLDLANEDWNQLRLKAGQAVASASKFTSIQECVTCVTHGMWVGTDNSTEADLFRFQKLPIELRYRIYDFAIVAPTPIHYNRYGTGKEDSMGFNLRATCKQIHEETEKFFFRNVFKLDITKEFKLVEKYICSNVREVSYGWWAFAKKDPQMFDMLNYKCPSLKVVNLSVTQYCIDIPVGHHKYQWLHHNVPEAKRFRTANGFDALAAIRGLDRINVTKAKGMYLRDVELTQKEVDDFASFLNTIVTQAKPEPKPPSVVPRKLKEQPQVVPPRQSLVSF